jgi:hypothetical protein
MPIIGGAIMIFSWSTADRPPRPSDCNRRNFVIAGRFGTCVHNPICRCSLSRALSGGGLWSSRPTSGKPPKCELDGSEGHEGGQSFRKVLKILGKSPVAPEP